MSDTAAPAKPTSELVRRTLAGIVMVAVALGAIWAGGIAFWLRVVIGAIVMMGEWCDLHRASPRTKRITQFALSVPLAVMAPASLILQVHDFFSLGLLVGAAFFVVIVTQRRDLGLGILYAGLPVLALMIVRRQDEGIVFALWALALVWMCDIGAYFAGRSIGGPKLAPRVSPNKTWAGLIGGAVAASLFGAAMHVTFGLPLRLTLATPVLAVLAQLGDLYESWLKRRAGVKDSGSIIPGHGGVMDRLDGLVPVAPLAAVLVLLPHFYR